MTSGLQIPVCLFPRSDRSPSNTIISIWQDRVMLCNSFMNEWTCTWVWPRPMLKRVFVISKPTLGKSHRTPRKICQFNATLLPSTRWMSDRTWQDVFEQYLQVFHPMMYHYTLAVCWLIFHSVFKLNSQWTTAESVDVRKCEPPVGRFKNHRYWWNSKHGRLLTKILAKKIKIATT